LGFKCGQTLLSWSLKLICDLFLGKFDPSNSLGDEVGDVDHSSIPLLPDWLLILCEPHMPAIFFCMEDSFILYNQLHVPVFLFEVQVECDLVIYHHNLPLCLLIKRDQGLSSRTIEHVPLTAQIYLRSAQ
jgi:hypothetical protein